MSSCSRIFGSFVLSFVPGTTVGGTARPVAPVVTVGTLGLFLHTSHRFRQGLGLGYFRVPRFSGGLFRRVLKSFNLVIFTMFSFRVLLRIGCIAGARSVAGGVTACAGLVSGPKFRTNGMWQIIVIKWGVYKVAVNPMVDPEVSPTGAKGGPCSVWYGFVMVSLGPATFGVPVYIL